MIMTSEKGKLNQKSLPERTADGILNMLHLRNYQVGAKLPNELQLASYFEVSRSTVRAAIALLQEKKILRVERGSGTYVADFKGKEDPDVDPLGLSLIYDKEKMALDLLDLRLMIEPRCALLAAQNASRRDRELLIKLCDEFDVLAASGASYVEKDMEFHQAIANCSGNLVIHNLIPYIHQMQVLTDRISSERRRQETAKEHRQIAEAIRDRRGADAFDAMQHHLNVIRNRFGRV